MKILRNLKPLIAVQTNKIQSVRCASSNIYNPDYLQALRPKFPLYGDLGVKLTGHDYPLLESYQRFVHKVADSLDMDVSECWAHPPKKTQIFRYKPNSSVVDSEYKLTTYERYLQISDVQTTVYPIFLRFIQAGLPEGVTLNILPNTDEVQESRFVPDKDLLDLKTQLDIMGGPITTKKK